MLIGDVARRSGVSARMLRHYDALGLVQPTGRTSGGYREYSNADIRRLFHVESLRTLGLSLGDVKRALDEPDFAPSTLVGDLIAHTRERIAAEEELLARLERVEAATPGEWGDVLHVVTLLQALESQWTGRRQQAVLEQGESSSLPTGLLVDALLSEGNLNVAGAIHWALERAPDSGLADLAAGLGSADGKVRRRAIAAIAKIRSADATELIRAALEDSDDRVRDFAAIASGSRGCTDAVPILVDMIFEGRSDVDAAEALAAIADVDVTAALEVRFVGADVPARLRLAQALAEIAGPAATDALHRLTTDCDRTVAVTASQILLRRRSPG